VGAGGNTVKMHIPGLQKIENVNISSISNRSKASSERVAKPFNIPKVINHWEDLVADENIDAVVIGTWPNTHCPITLKALEFNKHVLCEARMARNAQEGQQMYDASQAKPELVTQVVPSPFTLKVDETITALVNDGYLGDILSIDVKCTSNAFLNNDPITWRQNKDISGNNIMMMGICYEAMMRWVRGAKKVMAAGRIFVHERKNLETEAWVKVEIPDHLDIIADMECGAQASFKFSSITGLAPEMTFSLYGSKGTIQFDNEKLLGGQSGDTELKELELINPGFWRVEDEFINAIRGKEKIKRTSFEEALKYMKFTDAVTESLEKQAWVNVAS